MNHYASTLNEFEKLVLERLLEGDDAVLDTLRQQLESCRGFERELTGAGFFLRFNIPNEAPRVEPDDFHFGDVCADMEGLEHGAGFVLFVRGGLLDTLQGYSFEEPWPPSIVNPTVRYVGDGQRDLRAVRKAWS